MEREQFISTVAGTFNFVESIFFNNKGIDITHDNSVLSVDSCFFHYCFKDYGGGIKIVSQSGKSSINKTCARSCYLTSSENWGLFIYARGKLFCEYVSYSHTTTDSCRDGICHDYYHQLMKYTNLSHISSKQRGFLWANCQDESFEMAFSNAYNITSNCDIVQLYSGTSVLFSFLNLINCVSLPNENSLNDPVGKYLFVVRPNVFYLMDSTIKNNKFTNLFYKQPIMLNCNVETVSTDNFDSNYANAASFQNSFLNTFLCQGKTYKQNRITFKRKECLITHFELFLSLFLC